MGRNFFFTDDHHLKNAVLYHQNKADIDLVSFDSLLNDLWRRVIIEKEFIWSHQSPEIELDRVLKTVKEIIAADLPQDWQKLLDDLWTTAHGDFVDVKYEQLHCPKYTSNGGNKTSSTGIAKAVGTESALWGM